MRVVLDSNAIIADYWLRSKRSRLLLRLVDAGEVELHVPEFVIAEVLKHFRDDLGAAAMAIQGAQKHLSRMRQGPPQVLGVDVGAETAAYEVHLRRQLAGAVSSDPGARHTNVAKRAVDRAKPFKSDGSGYPDALLWELVKELAATTDEVAFISDNKRDFGGDKDGGLAPELVAELEELGLEHRVTRFPTLTQFHSEYRGHERLAEEDLATRLYSEPEFREDVMSHVASLLTDPSKYELPRLGSIRAPWSVVVTEANVESVDLVEVIETDPDQYYAVLISEAEAVYEHPAFASEGYQEYESGEVEDFEHSGDPDDPYATVTRRVSLSLNVDADYDPESRTLGNFEIASVDVGW